MTDTGRRKYEPGVAASADATGRAVNYLTERAIAGLIVLMVLDVGIGVVFRYGFGKPLSWTEELARYLMIWGALLAISACVARREHIGFTLLFDRLPAKSRRYLIALFDVLAFSFFTILVVYGVDLTATGLKQRTMSLGISMGLPYASVPAAAAIAVVQTALVGIRDFTEPREGFEAPTAPT